MKLRFNVDIAERNRWFVKDSYQHPAKLHLGLLKWLALTYTEPGDTLADPMGGIGSLLWATSIGRNVITRDVDPRWIAVAQRNADKIARVALGPVGSADIAYGDARKPFAFSAEHIIFSPPYGCASKPRVYTNDRARVAKLATGGNQRWAYMQKQAPQAGAWGAYSFSYGDADAQVGHTRGQAYWDAMHPIYTNCLNALRGGYLILIIKDHIKDGQRVHIADQTVALCESLGSTLHARHTRDVFPMSLWTRRRKEQGLPVIETEDVLVFTQTA